MKKNTAYIRKGMVLLAAVMAAACTKQSLESTYSKQEERIDSFIESQLSSVEGSRVVRNGGSNRLVLKEGEGTELEENGTVSFYYAGYTFSGNISPSNMFTTNHEATAAESGWNLADPDFEVKILDLSEEKDIVEGLRKGLIGVKTGEEGYIVFSGKYGFGKKPTGTIPANSALLYHVWIESVSNK